MSKIKHKVSITVVCIVLGFLLSYQFKVINRRNYNTDYHEVNSQLLIEIEELNAQLENYKSKINELEDKTSKYENAAANRVLESKIVLDELESLRLLSGDVDVVGEGVIIQITPKSDLFNQNYINQPINDHDIVTLINELKAVDAEAISVNDIRVTASTGIRNAGNAILVGKERISYKETITIKAIGSKELLEAGLTFPGNIPSYLWEVCDISWKFTGNVEIPKRVDKVEFKYAVPVENKE